jgi:hypothetical protein
MKKAKQPRSMRRKNAVGAEARALSVGDQS